MKPVDLLRTARRLIAQAFGGVPSPHYTYRPGDIVVEDFAEFSKLPLDIVADRIADCKHIKSKEWHALTGKSFSERAAIFYESSQNYVFGILSANPSPQAILNKLDRFNPRIMAAVRAHPGKRFFEFGGGTGVFCEIAARMGKDVYYMELPGIVFDFARWRFNKYGLKVAAIEAKADRIYVPGKYDIIYTDAVIEHLPPTLQLEASKAIGEAVDEHGLLIFLVDLSGPTEKDPMHHEVDIRGLHDCLKNTGLNCEDGYHTSFSIWRRL